MKKILNILDPHSNNSFMKIVSYIIGTLILIIDILMMFLYGLMDYLIINIIYTDPNTLTNHYLIIGGCFIFCTFFVLFGAWAIFCLFTDHDIIPSKKYITSTTPNYIKPTCSCGQNHE